MNSSHDGRSRRSAEAERTEPMHSAPVKKRKRPSSGRIILFVLLALAALALIALIFVYALLNRVSRPAAAMLSPSPSAIIAASPTPAQTNDASVSSVPAATPTPTPLPLSEVYPQTVLSDAHYARMEEENSDTQNYRNILLIGVDRRGGSGNSSADTIMIATIDKANNRLKLSSLLRDMLVEIPGQELYGKLNSSAAYGGVDLLMQTINKNFRLNISEYVLVDFNMFIEIVDRMGGVTVKMSAEEISAANDCIAGLNKQWNIEYLWDGFIFAEAGNVQCTGKQALGYARIRHLDSDFKRTNRQYKVLTAIYAKFRSMGAAKQYGLMYDLLPMVETNMQNEAILDCALQALTIDTSGILQSHAPADGSYESGRYDRKAVLLTDLTKNALLLHDFIYRDSEEADKATVLQPGASLPPRTPRPVFTMQDANGNTIYYYEDGTLVPGQTIIYPEDQMDGSGLILPVETPWQSLGDIAAPVS